MSSAFLDEIKTFGSMPWKDAADRYFARLNRPEEEKERRNARAETRRSIQTAPAPTKAIKVVISDIDECKGSHYSPTTWNGCWALFQIANAHKLDFDKLCAASRTISDWYIGHHEFAYLHELHKRTGLEKVLPQHNVDTLHDWHKMRMYMYQKAVYRSTVDTVKTIKNNGGLFFNASSGVFASSMARLSAWGGAGFEDYIDGIAVRENLDGMSDENPYQTKNEQSFKKALLSSDRIYIGKGEEIKPHPAYLLWCLEKANALAKAAGAPPIKPQDCLMIGDSLKSDMGAAGRVADVLGSPMQSCCIVTGVLTDPLLIAVHNLVGGEKSLPSAKNLKEKAKKGDYVKPNYVVERYKDLLNHVQIVPACAPSRDRTLDPRAVTANVPACAL